MVDTSIPRWTVPPLENGDRLDRDEFQRRYDATPNLTKAELIEGIVYMPAALRFRSHGQPHSRIIAWLVTYEAMTLGVAVGNTPTVWLDRENAPQPDAVLLIAPEVGGQAQLTEDDYVEGAPELIVEVAASSVSIDLHGKKQAYCRNGVKEYIVWQVLDQVIRWFVLENSDYIEVFADPNGIFQSRVFAGLWLDSLALLRGDMQQVFATLQSGLQSPEHKAFVANLAHPQA